MNDPAAGNPDETIDASAVPAAMSGAPGVPQSIDRFTILRLLVCLDVP